jgi:hypothetical protein
LYLKKSKSCKVFVQFPDVELVAAWVEHKVAVTKIAVGTVDAEAIIARAMSGVTVVYGVIVNAVGFAVSVAVKNLCLLWLCHQCGVMVIHPTSVGSFMCSVALRVCFGSL